MMRQRQNSTAACQPYLPISLESDPTTAQRERQRRATRCALPHNGERTPIFLFALVIGDLQVVANLAVIRAPVEPAEAS